jgi:drug/metabolite transporter (DMT)-like permease
MRGPFVLMNRKHTTAFTIISLIGGSLWIARQMVAGMNDQLWVSELAYFLSALALGALAILLRISKPKIKETGANVVVGVTLVACPYLLSLWGATRASPGLAAMIVAATPLVVAFLWDVSWTAKNAAIAGLAGVILVVADIISTSGSQWKGAIALLGALVATAGSLVFAKKHLRHSHPVFSASVQLATAACILAAVRMGIYGRASMESLDSAWLAVLCISAGSCIVYPFYFWLLQQIRPDQLASVVWAQLIVSVVEGIFLLRPQIPFRMVLGAAVIGGALVFMARSESENKLLTVRVTPASKLKE